jgi:predicted dehydrogenase
MTKTSDRKVKVGVVGCGVVATAHYLPYLMRMKNAELIAVCDRFESRVKACTRLFGAKEQYLDYNEMIDRADVEAVLILTAPGTHVPFALKAVEAGKHVLIQKPMATNMHDARKIAAAVRKHKVKAVIEPSWSTPLDSDTLHLRELVRQGVLGDILCFALTGGGATVFGRYGNNPYGQEAFFTKDSGGFVFDFPYAPTQIVGVLGPCKSVMASARLAVGETDIVPEEKYDEFLAGVTDPDRANYWDVVLDLPRTKRIKVEAVDHAYSLYEMVSGGVGCSHVGRISHPVLPQSGDGALQIFGTDGNLIFGSGHAASIISKHKELLPKVDADGWYHLIPQPRGFNYYHESTRHLVECILEDREPVVNVDWGLHITEMMIGAIESYTTGKRYDMTTTLDY